MEATPFRIPSITLPFSYTNSCNSNMSASPSWMNMNMDMDSRIWSRLPQRLIDRVIALLPPPAFFRARAVCKRWYALLFSNSFLDLYLQVSPPRRHWFLFFKQKNHKISSYIYRSRQPSSSNTSTSAINYGTTTSTRAADCQAEAQAAYLFDPYNVAWYILSFSSLIPPGFSPASSSGGLICWVSDEAGSKSLLLSNPLNVASLTPLPSTLRPRLFPSIGLNVTTSSIDIAVAGDDLISPYAVKNLTTESFHVDGGGFYSIWGTTCSLPRLCSLESGRMVYVGGRFYCMNDSPFSVLAYDVAANNWCKIQAPMRRFLRSPSLVESRGKLILIAAVEKSKLNVPKSLRLWGLQSCGTTWVEIERMPQQLYAQFAEVEGGRGFNCVGNGEFIVLMIRGSSSHHKVLLFDFCRKTWLWIPPPPLTPYDHRGGGGGGSSSSSSTSGNINGGGELHGFAYEPRLATPITALLDQLTLPFQSF